MCRKTPELWSVTYIHTYRQSDMVFIFLRMRLLASPFGLAINQNRITYCTFLVVEDLSPSISQLRFLHQVVTAITAVNL
jgi:hypothetical protein